MNITTKRGRLSLAIVIALLGIVLPYLLAWRISPAGTVFTGFLINPIDGFSYLAKMRQGYDGSWLFQLPYAAEPGRAVLLYIFHITLGHISRLFGAPLILTYHVARVLISTTFFVLLYLLFDLIFLNDRLTWASYLFALFGSGLGWVALLAFGIQTIDLWVPEAIPFMSAYSNAHFPLAGSAFVGGILLVFRPGRRKLWQLVSVLLCGFVLGAVLPFSAIPLLIVLAAWLFWEGIVGGAWPTSDILKREFISLVLLFLGALPWMLYDYSLSLTHPVISEWNAQNLTPSPPLIETLFGFGLMFAGAAASLFWQPWKKGRTGRLLTVWFVIGFFLLYVPLPFQRRLSMGLYLPMAGLTAWLLEKLFTSNRSFRIAHAAILASSLPSLLLVLLAGASAAARGEQAITYSSAELEAYAWLEANADADELVLTNPRFGNRLPAHAPVRVLYGHPFETPDAEFWRAEVLMLLDGTAPEEQALELLDRYGVGWVLTEASAEDEAPAWLGGLTDVERFDTLVISRNGLR